MQGHRGRVLSSPVFFFIIIAAGNVAADDYGKDDKRQQAYKAAIAEYNALPLHL